MGDPFLDPFPFPFRWHDPRYGWRVEFNPSRRLIRAAHLQSLCPHQYQETDPFMSKPLASVGAEQLQPLDRPYDGRGTHVDSRIKANRPTYRDAQVNAGKIPAAWHQPTIEGSRILTVHV